MTSSRRIQMIQNPQKTQQNKKAKNNTKIPDESPLPLDLIELHLERMGQFCELEYNKIFLNTFRNFDEINDIDSSFYNSISVLDFALSSHFDFVRLSKYARKHSNVVKNKKFLSVFDSAFNFIFNKLHKVTTESPEDPVLVHLETIIFILLNLSPSQKLKYWQDEVLHPVTILLLKGIFGSLGDKGTTQNLECLCRLRPNIMREIFGASQHTVGTESIAELLEMCFEIKAVHSLNAYQGILIKHNLTDESLFEILKVELCNIVDLDPEDLNTKDKAIILMDVVRRVQLNDKVYWKKFLSSQKIEGTILHTLKEALLPFSTKYCNAEMIKEKLKADWNKTILPHFLDFLQSKQNVTEENKKQLSTFLSKVQSFISSMINNK